MGTVDANQKNTVEFGIVYTIIYKVLYIPGGFFSGFLKHQQ